MAVLPLNSKVIGAASTERSAVGSDSTRRWTRGSDVEWGPSGLEGRAGVFVKVVDLSYSIVTGRGLRRSERNDMVSELNCWFGVVCSLRSMIQKSVVEGLGTLSICQQRKKHGQNIGRQRTRIHAI